MPRHPALILVLLALAVGASACGKEPATATTQQVSTGGAASTTTTTAPADGASEDAPAPTRAAFATGSRLQALVAAYRPVSARIDFLVAAETLRQDAIDSKAGDAVLLERTGTVGIEIRRMRGILVRVRPRVASLPVNSADEQHVQQLMLDAITARQRAVRALERELAVQAGGHASDSQVDALHDQFSSAWDDSLRSAREAMTSMQDLRARMGLDPAPEEAIR